MSLGLSSMAPKAVLWKMMTTGDSIPGHVIVDVLGIVEAVAEKGFSSVSVGHVGMVSGGGLAELVEEARKKLGSEAAHRGGNAIVGFRYTVGARSLEKSVLAYGTAVTVKPVAA